ncbi:MAG: 4Fe-4S dicluster domain-containing protein [Phycisphaerales bacterium]
MNRRQLLAGRFLSAILPGLADDESVSPRAAVPAPSPSSGASARPGRTPDAFDGADAADPAIVSHADADEARRTRSSESNAGRSASIVRSNPGEPSAAGRRMIMRYPTSGADVATDPGLPRDRSRRTLPLFRPPGAISEPAFLDGCTRCDACITACPVDALQRAPERFGPAVGTPIIDADRAPCRMCEDRPCIEACEPGVLTDLVAPLMGTARIKTQTCLAHQGTTCTACSEQCPVDDAIHVDRGRPTVNESACTGCGVCRYVCPSPENAVLLMPTFSRPAMPVVAGGSDESRHANGKGGQSPDEPEVSQEVPRAH